MARPCSVCTSISRRVIDDQLSHGEAVQVVARNYDIGESSLRRHIARHLSAGLLREVRASADLSGTDLIDNLVSVLADVNAVRAAALGTGQSGMLLRAATATREVVGDLLELLGVDAVSASAQLKAGEVLAKAAARTIRAQPQFGAALAQNLESLHDLEMAAEVRQLVARSTEKDIHS